MIHDISNIYIMLLIFLDLVFPTMMEGYGFLIALFIGIVTSFYTYTLLKKGIRYDKLAYYFVKLDSRFQNLVFVVYVMVYFFRDNLSNIYMFSAFILFTGIYIGFKIMLYIIKLKIWEEC